ncbi:MAG: hypothetical protein KME07_10155 [Pegethrix bostrychoides GSE-TBD4-15B]|uniref:Glycosyltransferase RgtA/B/C/D-like domain-containing protein n=1 Tax=Pegethrix bostrychoides GSE-TBD4-15B TaxID=2839662 RepID=A0A951PAF3_9CYAN|nr:hypothetical protein [Pegethrix bostrychoides GSE-TBD4-15B]
MPPTNSAINRFARQIVGLWLVWLLVLWGYQAAVTARYQVQRPDSALFWTAASTGNAQRPILSDPFMNAQVAWDSEFYLSLALYGYDDPEARRLPQPGLLSSKPLALNYAFYPVYPYLMRLLSYPLGILGFTPIATATLAGLVISALGTLAGILALASWVEQNQGQAQAFRAVAYLLSFPTGFFLAQVYTEGLYVGLSFGCLALLRRHWGWAVLLATVATLTRAVGILLIIPLGWAWIGAVRRQRELSQQLMLQAVALLLPVFVHLVWRFSFWGKAFQAVQQQFFNCGLFNLRAAASVWNAGFLSLSGDNAAAAVYYAIELSAIALGIFSCLLTLRRYPGISIYGLLMILVSITCGTAWSFSRYLLAVPSVFLVLSHWGDSPLFDRVWSLISILLLAMFSALFSFNFWAG